MKQFQPTLERIWREFSGGAAWQTVADLSRFHRIQASPGHRRAATLVHARLVEAGLQAEILCYPANTSTHFWAWPSFQEWECSQAQLTLIEPDTEAHRLADFHACPISVIQRSAPFEGEVEVVLLQDGEESAEYEGVDVAGKLVLSRGDLDRVHAQAIQQRGALGILYDGMRVVPPVRPAGDLADARQYTSFWWLPGQVRCFGFVLTPRQGQRLRRLLAQPGTPVRVRAQVASRCYDGQLEVVSASIPGQDGDEIVVVAHLCHPQPSANDNASGAAAALEAARTLQGLISRGDLPRPRRTIRFLWLPEMTGSAAYLAGREADLQRLVAGLNLDMVGEDQCQTGSSWLVERPPDAAASFAPELLAQLRHSLLAVTGMADVSPSHTGLGEYPLYRLAETPFSGGSDHYILSDPSVGVPTPLITQWPDRFYHTSADTPDRTDPNSLARAGALAAAYAYWLATASTDDAIALGYDMVARYKGRLLETAQAVVADSRAAQDGPALAALLAGLDRRLAYLLDRQKAALDALRRLAPVDCLVSDLHAEVERTATRELAWAQGALNLRAANLGVSLAPEAAPAPLSAQEHEAAAMTPVRQVRGPIPVSDYLHRLPDHEQEAWRKLLEARKGGGHWTLTALALYWADGSRSVLDIVDRVELETGTRDVDLILAYFRLLQKLGFVRA